LIPGTLLDWYMAVFQHGERSEPPSVYTLGVSANQTTRALHITTTSAGALIFEKLFEKINDPIVRVWPSGVCILKSGDLVSLSNKRIIGKMQSKNGELISVEGGWLIADIKKEFVFTFIKETNFEKETSPLLQSSTQLLRQANRLFLVTDRGITEIIFTNLGKPILSLGKTWGVMTNSTLWFDGVGIEDVFGSKFLVLPFDESSCSRLRARELDDLRVLAAKAGNRFLAAIGLDKKGIYRKLEFAFDRDYKAYQINASDVDNSELNIAILPKGVCAAIAEDGELNILVPSSGKINKVTDKNITTDMELCNWEDTVLYIKNGSIWKLRMK